MSAHAPDGGAPADVVHILHVEDEGDFADLAATFLERADDRFDVETVPDAEAAREALEAGDVDCVVCDYNLPGRDGIAFLEAVRETHPDLPFILYTGRGSEEVAAEAISAGVTDYLQKEAGIDQFAVLANRVANAVEHARSRRLVAASERRLREVIDALPHLLYVVDASGHYLLANEALARFHGTTVDAVEGAHVSSVLGEAPAERFLADLEAVVGADEGTRITPVEVPGPDGEPRVFDARMLPYDLAGQPAALGIAVDITERMASERELEATRERMELALERTDAVIFEIDLESGAVHRHGSYERFFSLEPADAPTWETHLERAVHPEDRPAFRRFHEGFVAGERDAGSLEYRTNPERGPVRWISAHVSVRDGSDAGRRRALGISRDVTARKAREEDLREKERRYQAVFNDPNILVGLLAPDGTVLDVNETAMTYVDVPVDAIVGAPFADAPWFDHSTDLQADVASWVERAAAGEYVEFEAEHVLPDGDVASVEGVFRPVTDGTGAVVSLLVSARDVTAQTERQRALQQYEAFLENSPDLFFVLDEDGVVTYQSHVSEAILGYELPDFRGESVTPYVHEEDRDAVIAGFESLLEHPEEPAVIRFRFRLPSGAWRWYESRATNRLDDPAVGGILVVNRDVTDRVRREQRLEALNETSRDLMTAEDREAIAAIGVEAARDILGLETNAIHLHDEAAGALVPAAATRAVYDLVGEPPAFAPGESIAWRVFESGEPLAVDDVAGDPDVYNPETPLQSELILPIDDHGVLVAGSVEPEAFDQGTRVLGELLVGALARALDQVERTDELRARERELRRQNDRLEAFASVVSHDLRNPLSVAMGRLEMLADDCDSEHLAPIVRAHDRMEALIADLLTLAREGEEVGDREPVRLDDLVEDCWGGIDSAEASLEVAAGRRLLADRSRLQQLLENLLRNAVTHGGADAAVTVGLCDDGFYVEDDGPGVPEADRERVFEVGYSTRTEGTGIGLAIVRRVAEAHGWSVTATEGASGGARFEVTGVAFVD